jgi:hypothetical protein
MERSDVCILINSTPKYFYLLPLQLTLLRRYASQLKWPIYFATEALDHPITVKLILEFGVKILALSVSQSGFLESRQAALQKLPSTITYVLPLQEDFLLDRKPDSTALSDALYILDTDRTVSSLRLTPCPGPQSTDLLYSKEKPWRILGDRNEYIFTYQATLWRRLDLQLYYNELVSQIEKTNKSASEEEKKNLALVHNLGESSFGQKILQKILPQTYHLCWPRAGPWSNAVYLCPWPYRPTAVTRGTLEPFAKELFEREGVKLDGQTVNLL